MNLSYKQIKEITLGAVNVVNSNEGISFLRFTEEQQSLYAERTENFWKRSFCTAGIKLSFRTNSKTLSIKIVASSLNTRNYFSVDVFANNKIIGYIDNFSDSKLPDDYTIHSFSLGEFSKSFQLDSPESTVCIHFPWSVKTILQELSIDDGAFIEPVKPETKLLAFGDSITQGYDALRPSNRYISKLANYLNAEEINKAIGGERFFPELALISESFSPEYIVVAYGTNDWNTLERSVFQANCKAFFKALVENYPDAKIIAITPIWRANLNEQRPYGEFENLYKDISAATEQYKNITVVNGIDFVPKESEFFADRVLHPNDAGFEFYYKKLIERIPLTTH